jgi:hypothetical protein
MRYVGARFDEYDREETYRIYVARSLQLAPQRGHIEKSYFDIVNGEVDNRTGDEIAVDIITRAGLNFDERI